MKRASLLIVEDDVDSKRLLGKMIGKFLPDLEILYADSGSKGLQIFMEQEPDLVITDINLPGMDGVTLVEQIKAIKPEAKVIVLTGYSTRTEAFARLNIQDYFVKPTEFDQLLESIFRSLR